jgi:hypothetical protein
MLAFIPLNYFGLLYCRVGAGAGATGAGAPGDGEASKFLPGARATCTLCVALLLFILPNLISDKKNSVTVQIADCVHLKIIILTATA